MEYVVKCSCQHCYVTVVLRTWFLYSNS